MYENESHDHHHHHHHHDGDQIAEAIAIQGLAPRTCAIYVSKLKRLHEWLQAEHGTCLDDAPAALIAAFAATVLPHARSSRVQLRSALKYYYEHIQRMPSPHRAVPVPPRNRMYSKALSPEVARRLFQEAEAWPVWRPEGLAVMFGLLMALRRFEIAKLQWQDFAGDTLTVVGKGGYRDQVPVDPLMMSFLNRWRASELPPGVLAFSYPVRPGPRYVFHNTRANTQTCVTPSTVWEWVERVSEQAGLGRVRTHVLRHTAITEAYDTTTDILGTMLYARHRDPSTTAGYTRINQDRVRNVASSVRYGCGETPNS